MNIKMPVTPHLFVIVGTPASGKDLLIRAVNDLGSQHAHVVPKHTSRSRHPDDGNEMVCQGDLGYDLANCDIVYKNYGDSYGITCSDIWKGLEQGISQVVVVVSNISAINELRKIFGEMLSLVYVHSEVDAEAYSHNETNQGKDHDYVKRREENFSSAFDIYLNNFLAFKHVLIHSNDAPEEMYDQIFRLFRAYERGEF